MTRVGDRERERAAASLRRHFVQGRLSVEELGARAELALRARSRSELRAAMHDLPRMWESGFGSELLATTTAPLRRWARLAAFLVLAWAWAVLSLALAIAFAVTLAVFGASLGVALVFAAVWGAGSYALWRPWLRSRRPARR